MTQLGLWGDVLPHPTWASRVSSSATQPGPLAIPGHPALSSELAPWARGPPSKACRTGHGGCAVLAQGTLSSSGFSSSAFTFCRRKAALPSSRVSLPQGHAMHVWRGHFLSWEPQKYSNLFPPEDVGLAAGPPPGTRGSFHHPEGPTPRPAALGTRQAGPGSGTCLGSPAPSSPLSFLRGDSKPMPWSCPYEPPLALPYRAFVTGTLGHCSSAISTAKPPRVFGTLSCLT